MADIVLDDKQAQIFLEATGPVKVRDGSGREMGLFVPVPYGPEHPLDLSKNEIDEIAERMTTDGPWATTSEVLNHIQSAASE